MAPPFPPEWRLNASTIILTGNISGWTDTAAAAKYGIVGFDWNNAKPTWKKPDANDSTCEATLLEQARRVRHAALVGDARGGHLRLGAGHAVGPDAEAAEARHLLCVCVFFFCVNNCMVDHY